MSSVFVHVFHVTLTTVFEPESDMKKLIWLALSSVFLSNLAWATENENWSAQSTEKQFEKTSGDVYKTSAGISSNQLSITPSVQAKSATTASKKDTQANTVIIRPEVKSVDQEFWIFDAWVEFHRDDDRDSYFNHFSVEFDVDTQYSSALVYARLYLGKNEVFKEYHTTSNFNIFSDSSNDSFVVESELLTGFSPNEYEVLIEVYDAYNDELVAVFDGNDDADLYLLSLESKNYESSQVVIVREHGGSLGLWCLFLVPVLLIGRQCKRA